MKRILFISLAFAALISCSKTAPVYEPASEIAITPVNGNITKSMMQTGPFDGETFKVWAWFNPVGVTPNAVETFQKGFDDATTNVYIDKKPFEKKSNGKWGGEVAYYWPSVGSLVFAGYHAPGLQDSQVSYTFDKDNNKMVFTGVQQGVVANSGYSEDIMYFNMTPSSYNKSSLDVAVEFKHALSWITVTLAKRVDPVIEAEITINSVKFTGVAPSGNGTVDGALPISWTTTGTPVTFSLPDLPKTIEYDLEVVDGETTYKTKIYTLQEHLFIPQDINGLLTVNYTVKSTDNSAFTETYEINLGNLKDGKAQTKWEPAKHYTYNLSIGTDEITVTPTVGDWTGVGTDILIPLPDDMYDNTGNE